MSDNSAIEWTTHTFNPWWGCARVSPGCRFCYADGLAKRYGHELWRRKGERRMLSDANWRKPLKWNRDAERSGVRARVFCASMADVFEDHPALPEPRARLWPLIEATPWLDWQLLTKRPENVMGMVSWGPSEWPDNVWIGTSVEDQRRCDERVPVLLDIPAKVRFLSCEPLLGDVLIHALYDHGPGLMTEFGLLCSCGSAMDMDENCIHGAKIHWVIAGGESGPKARPMSAEWVRSLRDQCDETGTAFLFKQWGGRTSKANGRELDGRTWDEFPVSVGGEG